jgi:gas vesicle protein
MADKEVNVGSILIAFAAGAIVGAGIALLYAPQSGEETRRMLADKAEELKRNAKDSIEHGKEILKNKRDQFAAAYEAGKEGFREAKAQNTKESEAPLG